MDLVGPINPVEFAGKRYFFTFTNHCTRYIETYTGSKKNNWLECIKVFHSLCCTGLKQNHLIERLQSDYESELQSHKADDWLEKEGIVFETSAPYSQEQYGVSERVGRTIMDMTRATLLEANIDDELLREIILAMTYIKNNRPTIALPSNTTPHEAQSQKAADISHLRVLGSKVYVFLYKEEQSRKSGKWVPRALKGTLVGYKSHTIHRVYIKDQNKVIQVKDLRIFEDFETKPSIDLPDYQGKPTFKEFLLVEGEKNSKEEKAMANQKASLCQLGRKVNNAENTKEPSQKQKVASSQLGRKVDHANNAKLPTPMSKKARAVSSFSGQEVTKEENTKQTAALKSKKGRAVSSLIGQEVHKEENMKQTAALKASSTQLGRNAENTKNAKEQTSRSGRTVKPTAKATEAMASSARRPESPPTSEPSREVFDLIV